MPEAKPSGEAKPEVASKPSADSLVAGPVSSGASAYAGPAGEVMRLLDQIASMRQENAVFEKLADEVASKMQQRLNAHRERVLALRLAYYHDLGRCLRDHKWPKRQREDFVLLMIGFTNLILADHGQDLVEDLLRYTGLRREDLSDGWLDEDGDEDADGFGDDPTDEAGQSFGEMPNPDDFDNAEDYARAMGAFFFGEEDPEPQPKHKAKGKKSDSSRRDEPLKRKSQDAGLFGDIRALYLMLARALHPDKEGDEQRRAEKTAWMQKVTAAYASKNLGDLLDILVRNPLDALGPYLAEAPLKTLKGFAKRLKRELSELRKVKQGISQHYHPMVLGMFRKGEFSEQAYKRWESDLTADLKIYKDRAKDYQNLNAVKALLRFSREHDIRVLV